MENRTLVAQARGHGRSVASALLNAPRHRPIPTVNGMQPGETMEVDRIGRMGPVTPERTPAWNRDGLRRRRFVAEVEPEIEDQQDDSEPDNDEESAGRKPDLDVLA